uniref:Uncharacterized protein n=1 Tax=Ditylenchus dipsaci TaxID=166011 RepID=A0A915EDS9_9BILA
MESVRQAGFTVFSFLTVSHNKLFSIATGPKHSLSLIEVDLETFEVGVFSEGNTFKDFWLIFWETASLLDLGRSSS